MGFRCYPAALEVVDGGIRIVLGDRADGVGAPGNEFSLGDFIDTALGVDHQTVTVLQQVVHKFIFHL